MKLPMTRATRPTSNARNYAVAAAVGGAALGGLALIARRQASNATQNHPAAGRFLDVDGVRLHYVEWGVGEPLVLIHGNGTQIQDFETSGLIDLAAQTFRVIAFDRPGFGYSSRPRGTIWTPSAQADLIHKALVQLGVERCILLGHSLGASVATALALRHPSSVKALVLVSGYYYPTERFDSGFQIAQASPILGDVLCHTLAPLLGRLGWPALMRKIFFPAACSRSFSAAVKEMALRPSQLRSSAADAALMVPTAVKMRARYGELSMPVGIVVGANDQLIDPQSQSIRLHGEISGSSIDVISGMGHMVHHGAKTEVMKAINAVAGVA
ncbi:MAG: alpha/beta hydrolase [Methylocella sp.]